MFEGFKIIGSLKKLTNNSSKIPSSLVTQSEHLVKQKLYTAEEVAVMILQTCFEQAYISRSNLKPRGEKLISEIEQYSGDLKEEPAIDEVDSASNLEFEGKSKVNEGGKVFDTILVPNIGDFKDVVITEIFIKLGDLIQVDDPLLSVESEKATMDIPSTLEGVVEKIYVQEGEPLTQGLPICSVKLR